MSAGGNGCKCHGPHCLRMAKWVVVQRLCNFSAFNGYKYQASDYSGVRCLRCGQFWRTKAKYVYRLRNATGEEARRAI